MDNLYSDLENYNEVNAIDELRQENKELKIKLKEYASSMDKLQKDFDNIASKYKLLETNYSSLLVTARAEVERKTQIISSLNIEKDMMVLNCVQNSTKNMLNIRRNMPRDRPNSFKSNRRDNSSEFGKKSQNDRDMPETKRCDTDRAEDNRMASIDTVSSGNTDETNKVANIENKPGKQEGYVDKNSHGKENITEVKSRAQSIRNRRKSMPALSKQYAKFSSGEEFEGNYSGGEAIYKDWPARDEKNRRTFDKAYHDKLSHKVSETSGIDDKYSSYHDSSRERNYKSKPKKYSDRYRSRDKYDLSQRHRRHLSPVRQRRGHRDHSDERLQKSEYRRHRVLESPPLDRYDTQRKSRDHRSNYEREYPYEENQRHRYERHAVKHKNLSDDEPTSKRVRIESYSRPLDEDVRWHTEIDHAEDPAISKMIEDYHTSCQSPDYILAEAIYTQPVKEIMNTAATPLEDPRIASQNYVTINEDGKVVLSTLTGRNVDLKVIDTSTWEIERVDVPDALRRPPQDQDELVKQIYMDTDDPASNMSIESGEIQSEIEALGDFITEIERNTLHDVREDKVMDAIEKQTQSLTHEIPTKTKHYKIPKLKGKSSELRKPICKILKEMDENDTQTQEYSMKVQLSDSKKTKQDQSENISFESERIQEHKNADVPVDTTSSHTPQRILTSREIIEGDLELSDEATELVIKPKINPKKVFKSKNVHKNIKKTNKIEVPDNVHVTDQKPYLEGSINIKTDSKVSILVEVERTVTEPDDPVPETNKKKKTKRKTQKDKGTTLKEIQTAEVEKVVGTKKRSKKEKEIKIKDLKPKFSDLFGDSSTVDLITPDDLGIPSKEPQSQSYVPIFEDALDAIDVNVDEIRKIELALPKVDKTVVDACSSNNAAELKFEIDKAKKVCSESTKGKLKKSEEAEAVHTNDTIKTVYRNLNIEPLCKEPDIVKTVIISTGIQPQTVFDSSIGSGGEQINNNLVDKIQQSEQRNVLLSKLQEETIQALATSTPHKNLLINNNVDTDTGTAESNCNINDSNIVRNDASSTMDQSAASNGLDSHSEVTDVPDVRIILRRRRKVVKK